MYSVLDWTCKLIIKQYNSSSVVEVRGWSVYERGMNECNTSPGLKKEEEIAPGK
jgi:hypothetical protein